MQKLILGIVTSASLVLFACNNDSDANSADKKVEGRWYTSLQVNSGKQVFKNNCAACHGNQGQGITEDWRKTLPNGNYPPPPLNGTAHTWHHSKDQLLRTINIGGAPIGGMMPAFGDKLKAEEKEAVMAYFMSLWPDDIYQTWTKRNQN